MALTESEATRKAWLVEAINAIQNAQLGNLTSGKSSLSFNGRNVTNMSPTEMETLRRSYAAELMKLERKEQGVRTRTIRCIG
ncbi:hypothetical protein BA893_24955 [Vibrio natriegens]|uniref:hypothetical protein n=1 Tax=Vibrio natriegens TaxID=691 RepID=UPI000804613D|nr:hypothetical protein [Vibrio natriegens]EJE4180226.1 hypothetical protein [Vibrio parahaemolyticus]ANQ24835.1 hypothetical protein BA893_24955 [Vibrio natriegens]MDG3415495.1 hypothetical protein [Vibrio parahaemolyticus]HBC3541895.1 hypothetical protein [Vibrio parahaemolyticus]HBC3546909.1 hypothetical protein [Vibrio parahaemolyticus]